MPSFCVCNIFVTRRGLYLYRHENRRAIMFLCTTIEAIVAVVAGILIAVCTKKADGVIYSKLDKIGRVTNILLLLFYVGFS